MYPTNTYLFSRFIPDSPFERTNIPISCPYDLYLADKFISERENQFLHAKELNAIHGCQIYKETLSSMFISKNKEDNDTASDSDEDLPLQFKPHQPRFMTRCVTSPLQDSVMTC